jgi:hypothetical protein
MSTEQSSTEEMPAEQAETQADLKTDLHLVQTKTQYARLKAAAAPILVFATGFIVSIFSGNDKDRTCMLLGMAIASAMVARRFFGFDLDIRTNAKSIDRFLKTCCSPLGFFLLAVVSTIGFALIQQSTEIETLLLAANSDSEVDKSNAISRLRDIADPAELLSDTRHPNRLNIENQSDQELFFRITGSSGDEKANNPRLNRSLVGGNVIGLKVKGLCLTSSNQMVSISSKTLTSSIDWNMTFRNRSDSSQEARCELELPQGAVVADATLWINGIARKAIIAPSNSARFAYQSVVRRSLDPLLITMLANNRIMLQCFPVPATGSEMNLKIGISSPLSLSKEGYATLILPSTVRSNFTDPKSFRLNVHSDESFKCSNSSVPQKSISGFNLACRLKNSKQAVLVQLAERPLMQTFAIKEFPNKTSFLEGKVTSVAQRHVKGLYVLIDTSSALKKELPQLKQAISAISDSLHPRFYFTQDNLSSSNSESRAKPLNRKQALQVLESDIFAGGKDNGPVLREILETASQNPQSGVLWIHGQQPIKQTPDKYLELDQSVSLWDYQIEDGENEVANSLIEDHLGQMLRIIKKVPVGEPEYSGLSDLITDINSPQETKQLTFVKLSKNPKTSIQDKRLADRIASLWARNEVDQLLANSAQKDAELLACIYHIVTPVSAALVLEKDSDYQLALNTLPELSSVSDTYRGLHQWFKDGPVGNVISNIGQLCGKYLTELINGSCADLLEKLMQTAESFSTVSNEKFRALDSLFAVCIFQAVLVPVLTFFQRSKSGIKLEAVQQKAGPSLIIRVSLMLLVTLLYCALIDMSSPIGLWLFQLDSKSLLSLGPALKQITQGGLIAAGAGATSIFAPLLANLAIPVAGQFVGQLFYFASVWVFLLIACVTATSLIFTIATLILRQCALIAEYLLGPLQIAMQPLESFRFALKAAMEIGIWTICWYASLKLLVVISFGSSNPFHKLLSICFVLLILNTVPKWLAKSRIGAFTRFLVKG